jgi:uncharacterized phage protein gp47/JayE
MPWSRAQALRIHQILQYIDFSAKQNLLKYSSGAYLDNLAAMLGLERLPAQKAVSRRSLCIYLKIKCHKGR